MKYGLCFERHANFVHAETGAGTGAGADTGADTGTDTGTETGTTSPGMRTTVKHKRKHACTSASTTCKTTSTCAIDDLCRFEDTVYWTRLAHLRFEVIVKVKAKAP